MGPTDAGQVAAEAVVGTTVIAGQSVMACGMLMFRLVAGEGENGRFFLHSLFLFNYDMLIKWN